MSAATSSTPDLCGYRQPDKSRHHLDGSYTFKLTPEKTHVVSLTIPAKVSGPLGEGTWTMVYDEGFFVEIKGDIKYEFFAFHSYERKNPDVSLSNIKPENYISHCDKTLVGWYKAGDKFGCWQGVQVKKAYPNVVITPKAGTKAENTEPVLSPVERGVSFLEMPFDPDYEMIERVNSDPNSLWRAQVYHEFLGKTNAEMLQLAGALKYAKPERPHAVASSPVTEEEAAHYASFLTVDETIDEPATPTSFIQIDGKIDGQLSFLSASKSSGESETDIDDSFEFEVESESEGQSDSDADDAESSESDSKELKDPRDAKTCEYGLPCELDWRSRFGKNWLPKVRNQGRCGSCYIMALMTVLESRRRIKKRTLNLKPYSPQHVLSCSVYNQGCDGGFPFLVGKHIEHFGIVKDECMPYQARDAICQPQCPAANEFPISNTRYVGGFYGNNSEEAMMRELMNGPITVAFESPRELFSYRGGIFQGPYPRTENQGVKGVRDWAHTNHAVVAVGWGHTRRNGKRIKYWIMRNSWGKHWGENGYFRILRGTDECGVEGMSVSLDIL